MSAYWLTGAPARCPVCMDDAPLQQSIVETGGGHFTKESCGHCFCEPCLRTWVETRVSDGQRLIPCPAPDCKRTMYADDIQRFLPTDVFINYVNRLSSTHTSRLSADPKFRQWVSSNARICPNCKVVILRSEGCNQMRCTCGTDFCYDCSGSPCKCPSCEYCHSRGHERAACPYVPFCKRCKVRGHTYPATCPLAPRCTGCRRLGHTVDDCTTRCSICKYVRHDEDHCPKARCDTCNLLGHRSSVCKYEFASPLHRLKVQQQVSRRKEEELAMMPQAPKPRPRARPRPTRAESAAAAVAAAIPAAAAAARTPRTAPARLQQSYLAQAAANIHDAETIAAELAARAPNPKLSYAAAVATAAAKRPVSAPTAPAARPA